MAGSWEDLDTVKISIAQIQQIDKLLILIFYFSMYQDHSSAGQKISDGRRHKKAKQNNAKTTDVRRLVQQKSRLFNPRHRVCLTRNFSISFTILSNCFFCAR